MDLLQAGLLRHRVDIQEPTDGTDSYGGVTQAWALLSTVWAQVEDLRGREFVSSEQLQSEVTTRITIRYRTDVTITPQMRAVEGTRTWEIVDVLDPDGMHIQLQLLCREVI